MTIHHLCWKTRQPCPQQQNAISLLDSMMNDCNIYVHEVDGNGYVTCLDISYTSSSALPADFARLFPEVHTLLLSYCENLTDVSSIGGMRKFRELSLFRCPVIRAFPEELCEGLKKLSVEHCYSFDYDMCLRNLEGLEEFVFEDRDLDQVPSPIWSLSNLKRLVLFGSRLTAIPNEIGNLTRLEELHIDGKNIMSLSRGIGALVHLKTLLFHSCERTELPDEMGELAALESLDFQFCSSLNRIPAPVLQLPNLKCLNLAGCNHLSIPTRKILECTDSLIVVGSGQCHYLYHRYYPYDLKRSLVLLQYMVWLNKNGRYLLKKKPVSLALWGAALGHWSKNVNPLFFFLKEKPDVVPQGSGKRKLGDL